MNSWLPANMHFFFFVQTLNALVAKSKVNPASVDDVILGCVSQVGSQGANLARTIVLSSVLPQSVPGTTCDRQCGSSLQAIHFAAQAVMSGTQDIVIAVGLLLAAVGSKQQASSLRMDRWRGVGVGRF
jgi:acetyl-CoA C-acetyltransferase